MIVDHTLSLGSDTQIAALTSLNEISKVLSGFTDLAAVMPRLLEIAGRVTPIAAVVVVLQETAGAGRPSVHLWRVPLIDPPQCAAILARSSQVFAYMTGDDPPPVDGKRMERVLPAPGLWPGDLYPITLPLVVQHGSIFGIAHVETLLPGNELSLAFLNALINQLAAAIDRHRGLAAQELLRQQEQRTQAASRALARSREELLEANKAKSLFLANMSHEIRTPLGAIVGFAELLSGDELIASERHAFAAKIKRNADQLVALVNDILDLSKVEAGRLQLESRPVLLTHLVEEVVEQVQSLADGKGIRLDIRFKPAAPVCIQTDPTRLRQALTNLVGNAVKFTNEGVVAVRVGSRDSPSGPQVVFTVADSGVGISAEAARNLFQPFTQADSTITRRFGGTGLGLVLSLRLATALGGGVELSRSAPGRGSVFRLFIAQKTPRLGPDADVEAMAAGTPLSKPLAACELAGLQLLLADDIIDNRVLLQKILTLRGASVDTAVDGADAVRRAMGKAYDVILMDLQMPVQDGFAAVRELRGRGYERGIIAVSAHAMQEELDRALHAGCDGHVSKPINPQTLVDAVADAAKKNLH